MRSWRPHEIALVVIATLAVLAAAKLAADFLVPVVAGLLLAYALEPLVARLSRLGVPRVLAATAVLATLVWSVGATGWWLRHDAAAVVAELPEAARRLRVVLRSEGPPGPLANVQAAAAELDKVAAEASGKPPAGKPQPPTVTGDLSRQVAEHGAAGLIKLAGQLAIAATLTLFLLTAGDTFRRKLVKLVGPTLAQRRVTVEILNEINVQVQRYLLVMLVTNILVALACWAAFSLLGLARPALWAVITGVLHFIPYVGGVLAAVVVAAAGLIDTGSLAITVWAVLSTLGIVVVVGVGFSTWLQGHACRMNAVAVFVSVLLFGWLWGGWGLLLGAPLAAVAKTIADRVEGLAPFGKLLGQAAAKSDVATEESDAAEGRGA